MTYQDAVKRVIEPYGNMMAVYMPESEDTLGSPVIQYGETDWEFIIRLGSRLHMPVYADYLSGEAGFKFGMVKGELVNTQVNSYHVGISSQYYKGRNNMPRENYLYYTIISDENYQIGDKLHITGGLIMEELYANISELVQDLLIPARVEKKINKEVFEKFYNILMELENKIKGEEYISRKIAGLLYFIYTSLSAETVYCKYDDELFIAVAEIEDMIDKILWDSPFKS